MGTGRASASRFVLVVAGAAALLLSSCGSDRDVPLRIGMVPDAGATRVAVDAKAPLRDYLSARLGREVELIIPASYNATVEALGNGSLDIAYLGGLTYAKAHARYGVVPLVQRDIDRQFHSLFVTRPGSGIAILTDLKGRSFCFGDVNSTSGHLMPRLALEQAGVPPEKALSKLRHTGSHPATAQAVAVGACDAGALDETVYASLIADGRLKQGALQVFHTTEPFTDYVWAARKGLPAEQAAAFSAALRALDPGKGAAVLEVLRARSFVPASNNSYADVARVARQLGLL
jgi:phosphonate transport system substrate-binding protein